MMLDVDYFTLALRGVIIFNLSPFMQVWIVTGKWEDFQLVLSKHNKIEMIFGIL